MAIDYTNYRPDLSTLGIGTGRYGARTPQYNRQINRIRRYFKTPRNYQKNAAGLGYVLPKIGGLRLRDINTAQGRRTAITGGPGNFIYGFTDRNKFRLGKVGDGVGLIARSGGGGGGAAAPAVPAPPTDEFTKYEKDYKWIADYLRNLKAQETATTDIYKNQFLPNLTSALNAYSNLGSQTAQRIAESGLSGAAAYGAAANVAPVEAAGATGSFDPISLVANQAAARATGAAAEAQAKFDATQSALAPVDTAAGILANIQRGYSAISAEYGQKRLEDQMKLEQWIEEQKSAAADREIQQQYNLGLLGVQQGELAIKEAQAKTEGMKSDTELAAAGFKRVPKSYGSGSAATIEATMVESTSGTKWFKPGRSGSGSGSGGGTPKQQTDYIKSLSDAYLGKETDPVTGQVFDTGTGYRESASVDEQATRILSHISNAIRAGLFGSKKVSRDRVAEIIAAAIPNPEIKIGAGQYRKQDPSKMRGQTMTRYIQNVVINNLSRAGLLG